MIHIQTDNDQTLVVVVRSPLFATAGLLGLGLLLWWLAPYILGHPGDTERQLGRLGGGLTLIAVWLVFYERGTYHFDRTIQQLHWHRFSGGRWQKGIIPFQKIQRIEIQVDLKEEPLERLALYAEGRILPFTRAYGVTSNLQPIKQRLQQILSEGSMEGDSPDLHPELMRLLQNGRIIEAVRWLRHSEGLSLEDARNRVKDMERAAK